MKKFSFASIMLALFSGLIFSQSTDDYEKWEVFAGYTHVRQVSFSLDTINPGIPGLPNIGRVNRANVFKENPGRYNGGIVSGVGNFSRYLGVKGEFSVSTDKTPFPNIANQNLKLQNSLYTLMGGIQIKDNTVEKKIKPFAHALAGASVSSLKITGTSSGFNPIANTTGFSTAFGGGLDIKLSNRIKLRAIQVDYNPIFQSNSTQHNIRFATGVVFN